MPIAYITAEETVPARQAGIMSRLAAAYDWLATWAERNVDAGEDGLHIPENARRIIENRYY